MTPKQDRFAREYMVDHNATQAAIRAGYAEKTAPQAASRLLAKVEVRQLVDKLTEEMNGDLGVSARDAMAMALELWERSIVLEPKIWKGEPVTWTTSEGGVETVYEIRSPAGASKSLELIFKKAGLDVSRTTVEHSGDVVYTLKLDRVLGEDDEDA